MSSEGHAARLFHAIVVVGAAACARPTAEPVAADARPPETANSGEGTAPTNADASAAPSASAVASAPSAAPSARAAPTPSARTVPARPPPHPRPPPNPCEPYPTCSMIR
jgi:hypothetical protein